MLSNQIFYHQITKKLIVAFGSLFSSIKLRRENADGSKKDLIQVPITYSPKEKWYIRVDQDPNQENYLATTLPRIAFEIVSVSYDGSRHLGKLNRISCVNEGAKEVTSVYTPVPYNIAISVNVITKTSEDGFQIIEQILPFFTPEYTMKVKILDNPNVVLDIPVILNGVSVQDDYEGDFSSRRFVTWNLMFNLKAAFFSPVATQGVIEKVIVDLLTIAPDRTFPYPEEIDMASDIDKTLFDITRITVTDTLETVEDVYLD